MTSSRPGPLGIAFTLAVTFFAIAAPSARATAPCSIDHAYPEVSELSVVDGRLVATLGTRFSAPSASERHGRVRLARGADGEWVRVSEPAVIERAATSGACMDPPPDADWLRRNYQEPDPRTGFDQSVDVCTTDGRSLWGGIGFYGAENGWGVGGLVREDPENGTYEYRRPYNILQHSVSAIQYFDGRLWLGRVQHTECVGPEPGFGLSYYDEGRDFLYDVPAVCGFAIRSMIVLDEDLWVASDLGLARAHAAASGQVVWQNFVPDLDDPRLMRPVTCGALYEELLRSPRLATDTAFDLGYAFEDFWHRLSVVRPAFVSRYLRRLHGHAPAGAAEE